MPFASAPTTNQLRATAPIILASTSATRRALCAQVGLPVECIAPHVDEEALSASLPHATPAELAQALAEAKAGSVSALHPHAWVIGADQVCALGTERFGKAGTPEKALAQLSALQGHTHQQHSGYAIAHSGNIVISGVATAQLTMRAWSEAELRAYVTNAHPIHSAGSYMFEGCGRLLFSHVVGTDDVIMGLALAPILELLYAQHIIAF